VKLASLCLSYNRSISDVPVESGNRFGPPSAIDMRLQDGSPGGQTLERILYSEFPLPVTPIGITDINDHSELY
jgi:hypothetical protein